MTATTNGKPQRKQLSDQIDRLDTIIDALADAPPEAVDELRAAFEAAGLGIYLDNFSHDG